MSKQIGNLNVQMETIFKKEPNGHSRTKKYTTEMKKKNHCMDSIAGSRWQAKFSKLNKGLTNRNYIILRTDIFKNIGVSKQSFWDAREHYKIG